MPTRRAFLVQSGRALAAGWAAGPALAFGARAPLAWPGPIGLQIYTVRDAYARDPARTLDRVAAIGYREVELIDMARFPAQQLNADLRHAGLAAVSGHFGLPHPGADWQKNIAIAQALRLRYMICPFATASTADGWRRIADGFNQAGRQCQAAGLTFGYHNHLQEFRPVGATTGYEILMSHTDPALVKFEMDVFWVTYAGQDPVALMQRYAGRYPLLHIKDMKRRLHVNPRQFPRNNGNPFAPVGQGKIDWKRVFAHVHQAGTRHIFVEQDRCDGPPMAAAGASYRYLRTLRG